MDFWEPFFQSFFRPLLSILIKFCIDRNAQKIVLNSPKSGQIFKKLQNLIKEVKPNLPWADEHFYERVGGFPHNPPPSHVNWPFAQKNNENFGGNTKFSHTYPERIWPKYASKEPNSVMSGIRFDYGDLNDILDLMQREPFTRQAYLPIWFPEDTGSVHGERVPCTLGYHFIRRGDRLHVSYYIRSCDYIRHFRDDVYLACRKLYWILENLKKRDPEIWDKVEPGYYCMHITSLHCFYKEKNILKQSNL
jgi:hypothetical protein